MTDRRWQAAAGAAFVLLAVLVYLYNPATSRLFPPCPLRALTGLSCPGCGSLRALHQLLHGHLRAGFQLNPLAVTALPYLGWEAARALAGQPPRVLRARTIWLLLLGILAFWLLRNL